MNKKFYFFVSLLLGFGGPLSAANKFSLEPHFKSTFGSHGYRGNNLSLKAGFPLSDDPEPAKIYVAPAFSSYKSDFSSGTVKSNSLRGEYAVRTMTLGLTLSRTPEINGYKNRSIGVDGNYGFMIGSKKDTNEWRFKRVDLGLGLTNITHTDKYQTAPSTTTVTPSHGRAKPREVTLQARKEAIDIKQRDLFASIGVDLFKSYLSAETTISSYDQDLKAISARAAQQEFLAGVDSVIQGFPHRNINIRAETDIFSYVAPFVSYTKTSFELDAPSSRTFGVGAYIDLGMVNLEVSYEAIRYEHNLEPKQNNLGLGIGARF